MGKDTTEFRSKSKLESEVRALITWENSQLENRLKSEDIHSFQRTSARSNVDRSKREILAILIKQIFQSFRKAEFLEVFSAGGKIPQRHFVFSYCSRNNIKRSEDGLLWFAAKAALRKKS